MVVNRRAASTLLVPFLLAWLLLGGNSTHGHAQTAICSAASLKGGYGIFGPGALGGQPATVIGAFIFDGTGRFTASGTFVGTNVAVVEEFTITDGDYHVSPDCTGRLAYPLHHETLGPADHFHRQYLVVTDGGRQFFAAYTHTEIREGSPSTPIESWTMSGQKM